MISVLPIYVIFGFIYLPMEKNNCSMFCVGCAGELLSHLIPCNMLAYFLDTLSKTHHVNIVCVRKPQIMHHGGPWNIWCLLIPTLQIREFSAAMHAGPKQEQSDSNQHRLAHQVGCKNDYGEELKHNLLAVWRMPNIYHSHLSHTPWHQECSISCASV